MWNENKRTRPLALLAAALVAAVPAIIAFAMLPGCGGGGGNELPYVPQSMSRDCLLREQPMRIAAREAGQSYSTYYPEESETSIQCAQALAAQEYEETGTYTWEDVYPSSITVSAGETLYIWGLLYNYNCYIVTPADYFTWEVDESVGYIMDVERFEEYQDWEYSSRYPFEVVTIEVGYTPGTGQITLSYKDYTDTITVTVEEYEQGGY